MTKGQCRKCAQRTGARQRGAGGVFSRMVPKPTEEKKSITVANNPNRRRSRWRDAGEGVHPRKRPRPNPPPPPPPQPAPQPPPRPPGERIYPEVVGQRNVGMHTPARVLLRLHHYDSDRKSELDARSPGEVSPLTLHGLATSAAYAALARPGLPIRVPRIADEEGGFAAFDPAREDELADQLEEAMRRQFDGLPEIDDGSPHRSSPDRFSPGSHHARMERYQRGQGHKRSMLSQIGSISGLDYGHQSHLQNADLVFWENLTT